jgi:hypothetical protein
MYAISEKSGIKWSTAQINFSVHIKIPKCPHLFITKTAHLIILFYSSEDTVQLKQKTQSPCLIKDYRNAELTRSLCVYVDGPLYPINKMYAISEKSGIKWSTAQINFSVHIKITKHCDDKE